MLHALWGGVWKTWGLSLQDFRMKSNLKNQRKHFTTRVLTWHDLELSNPYPSMLKVMQTRVDSYPGYCMRGCCFVPFEPWQHWGLNIEARSFSMVFYVLCCCCCCFISYIQPILRRDARHVCTISMYIDQIDTWHACQDSLGHWLNFTLLYSICLGCMNIFRKKQL